MNFAGRRAAEGVITLVAAGGYGSIADVVRAGLEARELPQGEDSEDEAFLATARQRWADRCLPSHPARPRGKRTASAEKCS